MKRSVGRLADGREIIWFDEVGDDAPRDSEDRRDLPTTATTGQLRYDALVDEWVAIASHRQSRTYHPPVDECPLCPSTTGRQTEVPSPTYDVVVFENRFPSLAVDAVTPEPPPGPPPPGPPDVAAPRPALGRCEVVCFTSDHDASFASLDVGRARLVVDAWADRTSALGALPGVEQVYPFENRGQEIGVTLGHPHGQIYAYPFVPPRMRRELEAAAAYRDRTSGGNLYADLLAAERAGPRVVDEGNHWTAFVPSAARWPVEVHLFPHRQVADIPALTDAERDDFCAVYLRVLRRLDGLYDKPLGYIAAWHQAPVHTGRDLAWLHLELFSVRRAADKLKYLAGSESGMGVFINDHLPEDVAARLRDIAVDPAGLPGPTG